MTSRRQSPNSRSKGPSQPDAKTFSAAEYPALRSFFRGYFHQDMKDEYGSAEEAVREFCEDASDDERLAVAREWSRFLNHMKGKPITELNQLLTKSLGSAYSLNEEQLGSISAILSASRGKQRSGS